MKTQTEKTLRVEVKEVKIMPRYSDEKLNGFKEIIEPKILYYQNELDEIRTSLEQMNNAGHHSPDDIAAISNSKEELTVLRNKTTKTLIEYQNALVRIINKSFGKCEGYCNDLIPEERLLKTNCLARACMCCNSKNTNKLVRR